MFGDGRRIVRRRRDRGGRRRVLLGAWRSAFDVSDEMSVCSIR